MDIVGVTQPVVKHNFMVRDVSELQKTIKEAFAIANAGRKGPVLIDIPKNVQIDEWEYDENMEEPCMERKTECGKNDISEVLADD